MSTLSIVVLSILCAIFGLILLASIAVLIWLLVRLHRATRLFEISVTRLLADHSSTLSLLSTSISSILEVHRAKTDEQIGRINGQKIEHAAETLIEAVPRISQLAARIERVVLVFGDLVKAIMDEQGISGSAIDRARESGLGPESYAPAAHGESYLSRSRTSEGDATALAEESEINTSTFNE